MTELTLQLLDAATQGGALHTSLPLDDWPLNRHGNAGYGSAAQRILSTPIRQRSLCDALSIVSFTPDAEASGQSDSATGTARVGGGGSGPGGGVVETKSRLGKWSRDTEAAAPEAPAAAGAEPAEPARPPRTQRPAGLSQPEMIVPGMNSRLVSIIPLPRRIDVTPALARHHPLLCRSYGAFAPAVTGNNGIAAQQQSQRPSGASVADTDGMVYQVSFKRNHRSFLLNSWTPCAVHLGDYVKVEADRGEDLGVVVGKTQYLDHQAAGPPEKVTDRRSSGHGRSSAHNKRGAAAAAAPSSHEIKRIIRHATEEEKIEMMDKAAEEDAVLKVCRTKVRHRTLQMRVIDAEYQFDRHKLTFFFEAERRIDFRELVRDLFAVYKTRIWLQQTAE